MQTVQAGDRVQVHYVKKFQDGSTVSSRGRPPLEITIGVRHARLPGLGLELVGLPAGASVTVQVSAENAYGAVDASRVHRWKRTRFPSTLPLAVGEWVQVHDRLGRIRSVRILEASARTVVVDANHRRAGQTLELQVNLLRIVQVAGSLPPVRPTPPPDGSQRADDWQGYGGEG